MVCGVRCTGTQSTGNGHRQAAQAEATTQAQPNGGEGCLSRSAILTAGYIPIRGPVVPGADVDVHN